MASCFFGICLVVLLDAKASYAVERYVDVYTASLDFSTSSQHPYKQEEAALVISNMKAKGINNLIITLIPNMLQWKGYSNNFKNFLEMAKTSSINLHLRILQTNTYTYKKNHPAALSRVQQCADFIKANLKYYPDPIKSIYINVEPNTLQEWRNADWKSKVGIRRNLMSQWLTLMESIRVRIKNTNGLTNLKIYAGVDYYYDSKYRQGIFPEGNPQVLGKSLDGIFIMAYFDDTDPSKLTTQKKLEYLTSICADEIAATKASVIIRASDYVNYNEVMSIADSLDDYFHASSKFLGVTFFKYETLQ